MADTEMKTENESETIASCDRSLIQFSMFTPWRMQDFHCCFAFEGEDRPRNFCVPNKARYALCHIDYTISPIADKKYCG